MFQKIILLLGLMLVSAAVVAQALPTSLYNGLSWRFVGPYRGGRTVAATGVVGQANVWYFGAAEGGVFKSTDAGASWQPLFQHEPVASIGAIAVAPSNPDIVYVGTGECDIRSDVSYGDGVWRSDDGGKTWRHIGLDDSRHVCALSIDPHHPNAVLAAVLGHAWGPNPERGVFFTTTGGRHWRKVLYVNTATGAVDLARDPDNPAVVYATTWNARRMPWFQYAPVQGPGSAVWRSSDGGRQWKKLPMTGLPRSGRQRIGVAVAAGTHGQWIYAIVSARKGGGVYRSTDGGKTWRLMDGSPHLWGRGWYFGRIAVDPQNPNVVYVPNTALYRSTDGGRHFVAIKGSPAGDDFHHLWIDSTDPARMIVAADQGAAVSLDDGRHWSSWYNQPTAQIYRIATDDRFPYRIYGTQQDSGSLVIPSRSFEGVITNRSWYTSGGGESGYIIPRPGDPTIVYGSDYLGHVARLDTRTHQITNISPVPIVPPYFAPAGKRPDHFNWVTPLAVSPFAHNTVYTGAQMLFVSTDAGNRWHIASPTLTGPVPRQSNCAAAVTPIRGTACGYGSIFSIAPSPIAPGEIWVGTTNGRVWLTRNGERHWAPVTPHGLKPWSRIARIAASPFAAGTAWIAVDRHRAADLHPYIYRTRDFGRHWTRADAGIPGPAYVHVVRADPARRGLLFAGTETGIYVSFNAGTQWQPLGLGLPTVAVRDLAIRDDDLIAGTHGRGLWVLDDIAPLRRASVAIARESVHLYRPAPAIRLRPTHYHGEPMPPSIPQASNPPTGAIIDYYLKAVSRSAVTLSIYGSAGHLVRRFVSTARPAPMPSPHCAPWWEAPPTILPDRAGDCFQVIVDDCARHTTTANRCRRASPRHRIRPRAPSSTIT